jgi:hypothetical protein
MKKNKDCGKVRRGQEARRTVASIRRERVLRIFKRVCLLAEGTAESVERGQRASVGSTA